MRKEIVFAYSLDSNCPPFTTLFNYQRKCLQPTSTTMFNKPLPSNIEANNVSNFIAYYAGHHAVLLASKDFYHLSTFLQKKCKKWIQEISDEETFVVKILYNGKWEIGNVNTTNICETFIYIIAVSFRITISSCNCVVKRQFHNKTQFVLRANFLNFKPIEHK